MDFLNSLAPAMPVLSAFEVVINLVLAFVMGLFVAGTYRVTNRNRPQNPSFLITMIILSMVVALVMMVIGNSVARAFSLVGALSIIRFRTVVKDNRDIAYIFFALAAGMAAGVGNYMLSLYGVGIIILLLLILDFAQFGQPMSGVYLLRMQAIPAELSEDMFETVFKDLLLSHTRLSTKSVRMGQFVEYSFLVRLKRKVSEQTLISKLTALTGMERVSLIAEQGESEA